MMRKTLKVEMDKEDRMNRNKWRSTEDRENRWEKKNRGNITVD